MSPLLAGSAHKIHFSVLCKKSPNNGISKQRSPMSQITVDISVEHPGDTEGVP